MGAIFRWVKELWLSRKALGQVVERATALLPQGGVGDTLDIFTIVGGRVKITSIIGQVTAQVGAVLNMTKLTATPTTGGDADICADLDTQGYIIGRLLGITGIPIDAMQSLGGVNPAQTQGVILKAGTLTLECDGTTVTGKVRWTLHYVPVDIGASVVAVAIP